MDFFRKKCRYTAVVKDFRCIMKKAKQSAESARIKMIQLKCWVPITNSIKKSLDSSVSELLSKAQKDGELILNSMDISETISCVLNIFSKANYSKTAKPVVAKGGENGPDTTISLKRFFVKEGEAFMSVVVNCPYDAGMWKWGGDIIGDGEIVIETTPSQPDLPFDKDAEAEEESSDE